MAEVAPIEIETVTGVRGRLVMYVETATNGVAVIARPDPTFEDRPLSAHLVYRDENGDLAATNGRYDMTWEQARELIGTYL